MPSIIQRSNFPSLMVDALNVLFEETMNMQGPEQFTQIYNVLDSKKMYETSVGMVGMGPVPVKPELNRVRFDAPRQGRPVTYVHSTFSLAVGISREAEEDDRSGQIARLMVPELAKSMRVTREQDAADIFNNSFTAMGYEPDGVSLINTAHPLLRPGFGVTTFSNRLGTDAVLSQTSLAAMRAILRRTVSESGKKSPVIGTFLVVPPELETTAEELTLSQMKPGQTSSGDVNAINVFNRTYKLRPVVLDYLNSTTAWWLVAVKADHHLKWYNRVKPQFETDQEDWYADARMAKTRARWSRGFDDPRGIGGTDGVP